MAEDDACGALGMYNMLMKTSIISLFMWLCSLPSTYLTLVLAAVTPAPPALATFWRQLLRD